MAVEPDAADLQTYLGVDDIDEPRAAMLVGQAVALCESYVSPLPEEAEGIVLAAAARAYANPTFMRQTMEGPYQATLSKGGVYLEAGERMTLRRMAGGGGAFSVSLLPTPVEDES